ncbi:hypothetical protein VTI74DRAFT_5815 [Chaetomium olivicolor]
MAAPANNPFGAPPQQAFNNPFGTPLQNPFGAPAQSPFGAPASKPNSFGAPVANPFAAPAAGSRPSSAGNPFGAPSGQTSVFGTPAVSPSPSRQQSPSIAHNPFGKAAQAQLNTPFGAIPSVAGSKRSPSPFGLQTQQPTGPKRSPNLRPADADAMGRKNMLAGGKPPTPSGSGFGGRGQNPGGQQRATPFAGAKPKPFAKESNGQVVETDVKFPAGRQNQQAARQQRSQPPPSRQGNQTSRTGEPSERTKELSPFAFDYANKLYSHLKKQNINPPQWPAEPGNPNKRGAIESLKEAYKKYRSRVYATLRRADLIDDPEKRRKLEDALPFKGICEDMCPEFEQVYRIAEYDVMTEEKESRPDGMWPDPSRMVKKFGRSAAGQDAPLPMDVRSVDALRRTTDYLFNDLLQSESNLPAMHNFLWDRTRAVRKDFTFHSQKSAEEMKDMVYCFETITRFHATALHLLSRKGFANEDFDQKQEIEQLGRTILSLIEAYDVCRDKRVHCENEPEFRAYYLLLNAHDPSIAKRIPTWGKEFWFESEEVQTALSLIQAMDDVREPKGPIKPRRPTTLSDTSFTNYFSIVEDPRVSYTMACIAEVHFTTVRQAILRNLVKGYARHRDAPRTITASDLNAMLRFDTPEEAVEFAELHDFEFSTWVPDGKAPVGEPYLLLNNKRKHVPSPRVRQAFSAKLVERKRTTQSLPHVIYNTIFEEPVQQPASAESSPGLFVTQSEPSKNPFALEPQTPLPPEPSAVPAPAPASNPFGTPAVSDLLMNGAATGGPTQTPASAFPAAPAFPGLQASTSTSAASSPFAAVSLSRSQAQAAKSPFSFLNQSQGPPTTDLTTPSQPAPAPTASSPFAASKTSEGESPFGFLKDSEFTPPRSLSTIQQPTPAFPPASSVLGNSAPKPFAPPTPPQDTNLTQPKPVTPGPSSSLLGLTPPAGATPLSATPVSKPTDQQPASAAPAVPSIFVSPPSVAGLPTTQAAQPVNDGLVKLLGLPPSGSEPRAPATPPAPAPAAPIPKPAHKRDLLGDFTKWFVKGDGGLMEHFTEEFLRHLLFKTWKKFEHEEKERKRREEEEQSWRLAREHMTYRLSVKYFYRWRDNARMLATKRILREGKEKLRLYRAEQRALQKQQQEEKEKAEKEARRAAKKRLLEDSHRLSILASSTRRRGSVAYSADHNPEEELLASGILSGMRDDPRAVARRIVNGVDNAWAPQSFRYPESELEFEPAPSALESAVSPDASSIGGKREGFKTRSLREKFGIEPRRSLSASGGSFTSSFRGRQSLPGNNKITNFSRKRSAEEESDDEPDAKRQSVYYNMNMAKTNGFNRSRHWDLRARGFVPTADGGWMPEAIAKTSHPMNNSTSIRAPHRYNLISGSLSPDGGAGPLDLLTDAESDAASTRAPSPTPSDLRLRLAKLRKPRPQGHAHGQSRHSVDLPPTARFAIQGLLPTSPPHPPFVAGLQSPPAAGTGMGKRKRGPHGEEEGDEEAQREVSPSLKKNKGDVGGVSGNSGSGVALGREETARMVENTKRMLRELREAMDRADQEEGGVRG